jgi:hypothetical protein
MNQDALKLLIPPALQEKMDRALITEDDVRQTITHCETTGFKLQVSETGAYAGHRRIGALTFWVHYKSEDGAFRLVNVYTHRAVIEEDV